jgi:hypothetical protein
MGTIVKLKKIWQEYRQAVWQLRLYEPRAGAIYAAAGTVTTVVAVAVPPGVVAVGAFVAHGAAAQFGVGLASLATVPIAGLALKRRAWLRPVVARLARWTAVDPRAPQVSVNVADEDQWATVVAFQRAGLVPARIIRRGDLLAKPLNVNIHAARSLMLSAVDYDTQQAQIVEMLEGLGVAANVGGIVVPRA